MSTNASVVCKAETRTFELILKEPVGQLTDVDDATFSVLATATGLTTSARVVDHAKLVKHAVSVTLLTVMMCDVLLS